MHQPIARPLDAGRAHVGVIAALAVLTLASVGTHGMSAFRAPLGTDAGPPRGGSTAITFINAGVHLLTPTGGSPGGPIDTDPYFPQASLLGVGNLQGANGPSG